MVRSWSVRRWRCRPEPRRPSTHAHAHAVRCAKLRRPRRPQAHLGARGQLKQWARGYSRGSGERKGGGGSFLESGSELADAAGKASAVAGLYPKGAGWLQSCRQSERMSFSSSFEYIYPSLSNVGHRRWCDRRGDRLLNCSGLGASVHEHLLDALFLCLPRAAGTVQPGGNLGRRESIVSQPQKKYAKSAAPLTATRLPGAGIPRPGADARSVLSSGWHPV
jgi:hypothetical protein